MQAPQISILDQFGKPMRSAASGFGAGGKGFAGQMAGWQPRQQSADAALLPNLELATGRADDLMRNNALASGGIQLHQDNIVGHLFRLSYKPRWQRLGINEVEMRAFSREVETAWLEFAEDADGCYIDAERKRTFTMLVREAVATHTGTGDAMAAALWLDRPGSLYKTAIKVVSPKRVCNPNHKPDEKGLSAGIESNHHGAALAYHVRSMGGGGFGFGNGYGETWERIPLETKHGRRQFIHTFEPTEDGQSRGANAFMAVMEQMHMLPKLQHTKLQNAIVNAMYAATIESELGPEAVYEAMGSDDGQGQLTKMMTMMSDFRGAGVEFGGARATHLFPNERLNLQTSGNADNGFAALEESIQRWIARGLNVPYEPLSQNYSKGSYSSIRASMLDGWRYFMGRRKIIASRYASQIFNLWLEEALMRKIITLPRNATRGFYDARAAWCNAEWIGSGRMAIDGLKEVKEAVLRISSGLSSYEKEMAQMGEDYQETFAQQVRETEERKAAGLPPPSWVLTDQFAPDEREQANPNTANDR